MGAIPMNLQTLEKSLYDLITETSTNLPKDVRRAIKKQKKLRMLVLVQQ